MSGNKFDLHDEMLATTSEDGHRVYLHPEDVIGKWRNRRTFFYLFWITIYFGLSWFKINGNPAIFLNLPAREFHLFGATFFAHDAPMLFFIFAGFTFFFAFLTSMWGRVWCGWGCPQTVFIDIFFQTIERLVEGKAGKRAKLDRSPWSIKKLFIKATKWLLFTAAAMLIAHGFIAYFLTPQEAYLLLLDPSQHPSAFIIMLFITALVLFDFGWFREQFCIIACPYGRIQAIFQDEHSYVVSYEPKRGEPRRGPDVDKAVEGDCINCYHCVKVCPTGIDIRRGTQMECIGCTACIDACDAIMTKIGKPTGLIRYDSEEAIDGRKTKIIRFRPLAYAAILIACIIGFVITSMAKQGLKLNLIRGSKTPYQVISTADKKPEIMNHFRVFLSSNDKNEYNINFKLKNSNGLVTMVIPALPMKVGKGNTKTNAFFKFPADILKNGNKIVELEMYNNGKLLTTYPVVLLGPLK